MTVCEVAGFVELGGGTGDAVEPLGGRGIGDGDGGVADAQPAINRTNARGVVNRRVQAFMALVRADAARG
jgi:hypothetical protein